MMIVEIGLNLSDLGLQIINKIKTNKVNSARLKNRELSDSYDSMIQ